MSEWISANDRLPEQEECVLLLCKTQYGTSYKCIGFYESGTMRRDDSDYCWDYEVCDIYDEENDDAGGRFSPGPLSDSAVSNPASLFQCPDARLVLLAQPLHIVVNQNFHLQYLDGK